MIHYRCCDHCADDPIHEDNDGEQLDDNHEEPCTVFDCFIGRRTAP